MIISSICLLNRKADLLIMDRKIFLRNALVEKMPSRKNFFMQKFDEIIAENGIEKRFLDRYIANCLENSISIEFMAESYAFIVQETMKEQMYFFKHHHYRFSTYDEVKNRVYNNSEYMKKYMIGLALSTVFWNNHTEIFKFFRRFLNSLDPAEKRSYLEIGAGHGLFTQEAIRSEKFSSFNIVDISPTSIELCKDMLSDFGTDINFICEDFLKLTGQVDEIGKDFIVLGETLEHVEQPGKFLDKIGEILSPNGKTFISTCINAPEPDHIFLFRTVEDVENLFENFHIEDRIYLPYENHSLEECSRENLPINVAYILKRD